MYMKIEVQKHKLFSRPLWCICRPIFLHTILCGDKSSLHPGRIYLLSLQSKICLVWRLFLGFKDKGDKVISRLVQLTRYFPKSPELGRWRLSEHKLFFSKYERVSISETFPLNKSAPLISINSRSVFFQCQSMFLSFST